MNDPVAHIRESLSSWIRIADEPTIRAMLRMRRNLDSNLRKPAIPAGWIPLQEVARSHHLNPGHLARTCREIFGPQELARICTHRGRRTWCLHPDTSNQLPKHRATEAPSGAISESEPSREIEGGSK